MAETTIETEVLAEKYTEIYRNGGGTDIRNFLFGYALGMERGAQLAKEPAPPAA